MALPKKSSASKARRTPQPFKRLSSSVRGLDVVLGGGLPERRTYLVRGPAGAGKTILASQLGFDMARRDANSVFVTLLSESHSTLMDNLRTLSFFDENLVGRNVVLLSGYSRLMEGGLTGFADLLRDAARRHRARLLVVDSIRVALERAESRQQVKTFLREISTYCSLLDCTLVLVAMPEIGAPERSFIETLADGIVDLQRVPSELRTVRTLEVLKLRGSAFLEGKHTFDITSDGLVVHPRTEARYGSQPAGPESSRTRARFGVANLDDMLRGGMPSGSVSGILGAAGAGKTLLGLQFLSEGARLGEPGLYFGFHEMPARLIRKAEGIGLPLKRYERRGLVTVLWQPPLERSIDALAEKVLAGVRERSVHRLFIDGVDGFRMSAAFPKRLSRFFAALTNELRAHGVTTMISEEIDLFSPHISVTEDALSAIFDNIVLLRYVELRSQLHRLLSILKVHESDYDSSIREFRISSRGIQIAASFESAEAVLSGYARHIEPTPLVRPPKAKPRP